MIHVTVLCVVISPLYLAGIIKSDNVDTNEL